MSLFPKFRALFPVLFGLCASLSLTPSASAALCGTIASPTACSITLANNVTFDASAFSLMHSFGAGGGDVYQGADIRIDIFAFDNDTVELRFSLNPDGPSTRNSFNVNREEISAFIFEYSLLATAAAPGSVQIIDPIEVNIFSATAGNGLAAAQLIVPGGPASCQAINVAQTDICFGLPGSITNALTAGDIVNLSGNAGNAALQHVNNRFTAEFTPSRNDVPIPATASLLMLGLLGLRRARRCAAS